MVKTCLLRHDDQANFTKCDDTKESLPGFKHSVSEMEQQYVESQGVDDWASKSWLYRLYVCTRVILVMSRGVRDIRGASLRARQSRGWTQIILTSLIAFTLPGMYNALSGIGGGGNVDRESLSGTTCCY